MESSLILSPRYTQFCLTNVRVTRGNCQFNKILKLRCEREPINTLFNTFICNRETVISSVILMNLVDLRYIFHACPEESSYS